MVKAAFMARFFIRGFTLENRENGIHGTLFYFGILGFTLENGESGIHGTLFYSRIYP